ncbi:MAG: thiamine phosphate synthase [Deltaproteobacteria bacterium]
MPVDFRILLITDRRQARNRDLETTVEEALAGGIRAVMLREKDLSGRELFRLAERLRERTRRHGARLLVNDRVDVALAADADGAHLGVDALPPAEARRILGPDALIGCSTHTAGELRRAVEGGADYVTFGPVYPTPSKARYGPPVGVEALARACRQSPVPVFALGGVDPGRVAEVLDAGAFGVALISRVVAAPDPRAAAAELVERVGNAADTPPRRKEGEP